MIIRDGTRLYETNFTDYDLRIFWELGKGSTIVEVLNDGAKYCKDNRHNLPGYPAGSDMALVEVHPVEVFAPNGRLKLL